jgi:hypothetical protein
MLSSLGNWQLLHDTAPIHHSISVQQYLTNSSITIVSHSPAVPSDYFPFPIMKPPGGAHIPVIERGKRSYGVRAKGGHRKRATGVLLVVVWLLAEMCNNRRELH